MSIGRRDYTTRKKNDAALLAASELSSYRKSCICDFASGSIHYLMDFYDECRSGRRDRALALRKPATVDRTQRNDNTRCLPLLNQIRIGCNHYFMNFEHCRSVRMGLAFAGRKPATVDRTQRNDTTHKKRHRQLFAASESKSYMEYS